jgi:two-component sensor histidine kinase
MTELAKFTGIALQMAQSDLRLKKALEDQEVLTREMDHQVKNLLAVTESMIRFTARSSTNKEDMAENLTGRLRALSEAHGLVRKAVNPDLKIDSVDLAELIKTILRPYRPPKVQGPEVRLGERATSSIALVFHELATNAAKYGALGTEQGLVKVDWSVADGLLELKWQELNGPGTEPPSKKGFGSVLVESTLSSYGGTIDRAWHPDGLAVIVKLPVTRLSI